MEGIRVRLRPGKDDDIAAWYNGRENKSRAVREAIRRYIEQEDCQGDGRPVQEMAATILDALYDTVSAAVEEALSRYDLSAGADREEEGAGMAAEMAAEIDAQLEGFFG